MSIQGGFAAESPSAAADVSGGRHRRFRGGAADSAAADSAFATDVEGGKRRRLCGKGKHISRAKKGSKNYRKCVHSKKSPTSHHMRRHYNMRRVRSPRSRK